jgi:hypothetical protein
MLMEKTVLCPIHKKELTFEKCEGRPDAVVAVCRCDPADKKWYGKSVVLRAGVVSDEKTSVSLPFAREHGSDADFGNVLPAVRRGRRR